MKKILLIAAVIAFSFASAQGPNYRILPPKPETNTFRIPGITIDPSKRLLAEARSSWLLPNGNMAFRLSQDNMPCIVPDMSQYNMPVVKPQVLYNIPNPAFPQKNQWQVVPQAETISPEKLQELFNMKIIMR